MASVTTATSATAPVPPPPPAGSHPPPPPPGNGGTAPTSLRLRIAHWMEDRFGKAYVPIAMAAGGIVGGGVGLLTLGPIGGIAGAALGALTAGALVFAG